MKARRTNGFVLGSDRTSQGQTVWKVRVKDPDSQYDGQKLIVASIHDGLEPARGLNVHFVIGTVDDHSGTKALRAVDVCLEATEEDQATSNVIRSGGNHERTRD